MVGRVRNAEGGTLERPCPTALSRWFGAADYCDSDNVRAWQAAAQSMYDNGISPAWKRVHEATDGVELPTAQAQRVEQLHNDVEQYVRDFDDLPTPSFWNEKNLIAVAQTTGLMTRGDQLIDELQALLPELGQEPVELPPTPTLEQQKKHAEAAAKQPWERYIVPVAIGSGVVLVAGVLVLAIREHPAARVAGAVGDGK